jgi:16S rRNA (guanine527-N7)-methyltransferase
VTQKEFSSRLLRRARKAALMPAPALVEGLWVYFDLLMLWNRKINLTSLELPDQAIDRLLLEPLMAARHVKPGRLSVIDIGSGGGSPALPLKLSRPDLVLTMVEAKARKSAFLREAVRQLGLQHVAVENARYQELLARPELHEAMQVVTIRAVRVEVRTLMSLQAFLAPKGQLFLFRGASESDAPEVVPPFRLKAVHPLVESTRSRLMVLEKAEIGRR